METASSTPSLLVWLAVGWVVISLFVPVLVLFCAIYAGRAQYYARICADHLKKLHIANGGRTP
jgi:hypothetical protein